jgi:uncharacterized protein with GYD domain
MAKYMITANYVGDGIKGLMAEGGTVRRDAAAAAVESVGGSLDAFYYAFGGTDVYAICDVPDPASAAALSLLINASGAVELSMTPLLTVEDLDDAAKRTPVYRAPGT